MSYTYEVREQPITNDPADRGTLIGGAATFKDALMLRDRAILAGRAAYISRVEAAS